LGVDEAKRAREVEQQREAEERQVRPCYLIFTFELCCIQSVYANQCARGEIYNLEAFCIG
jgi:hypothetical protein